MADRTNDATRRQNERRKKRSREALAGVADIGVIPAVVSPERREACRLHLQPFLELYFPASTGLSKFSPDHEEVIGNIEAGILHGGLFCQAVYRGFAKTTIAENSAIWAVAYGHRRFVPIFGADANAASGNIESIKTELAENDLLYEDFPELCHPIRALEGKPQRCASQTHVPGNFEGVEPDGGEETPQLTHIAWTADTIVLPTITMPDGSHSPSSGAILTARGIEGGSRGMKHKRPDGTQQRPDFAIIDDPQTDQSASTPLQVKKRSNVIRKSILRLGGHNKKMAVVMNATVIRREDLVEEFLNPKLSPAWQGKRIKMVRAWAGGRPSDDRVKWEGPDTHDRLWLGEYARLRNDFDPNMLGDQQRAHRRANEFYRANREAMDAGAEVSWASCYDRETELSAVQHAYNILIDDGADVFASECQNEPLRDEAQESAAITAEQIAAKVNGRKRGLVPAEASRLVVFLDPKKNLIYWTACAFGDDFSGYVVDYGTWPEQGRAYFAAKDVRKTLEQATGASGTSAAVYAGLESLTHRLMTREWGREDGTVVRPERVIVDANWGEVTDAVYLFCRQSDHAAVLLPSHGKYVGASQKAFADWQRKPGDRVGLNWRIPAGAGKRSTRHLLFDTNSWKSFVFERWRAGMGGRGCLSLFVPADSREGHRLFADHQCAEYGTPVEARGGRTVTEWHVKPGRPDNDYFDCIVGCHVGASILGASLLTHSPVPARKRVKLSEIQKKKR